MTQSHKSPDRSFTQAAKARAFFRGLLSAQPLLEVAAEGIVSDPREGRQVLYARRLVPKIDPERACDLIRQGIPSRKAEAMLASAISERGDEGQAFHLLIGRHAKSHRAQELLSTRVTSGIYAYILLRCGTLSSPGAHEILAATVRESGLSERAADLLLSGLLLSDEAKRHVSGIVPGERSILARIILSADIPHDVRVSLCRRMPPICTPFEEKE